MTNIIMIVTEIILQSFLLEYIILKLLTFFMIMVIIITKTQALKISVTSSKKKIIKIVMIDIYLELFYLCEKNELNNFIFVMKNAI